MRICITVLTFLLVLKWCSPAQSQFNLNLAPSCGLSLTKKNTFPSSIAYGSFVSLSIQIKQYVPVVGGSLLYLTPKSEFLKQQQLKHIYAGLKIILDPEKDKFHLGAYALMSQNMITPDNRSLPDGFQLPGVTYANNFGYQLSTYYYFKQWLGCSLTYIRLCAHSYEAQNYQSLLTFSMQMRLKVDIKRNK